MCSFAVLGSSVLWVLALPLCCCKPPLFAAALVTAINTCVWGPLCPQILLSSSLGSSSLIFLVRACLSGPKRLASMASLASSINNIVLFTNIKLQAIKGLHCTVHISLFSVPVQRPSILQVLINSN